jgi:prepilin peptidase CpaA
MIFAWIFAQGWMGGGDVKLFAALALWLPWKPFLQMMIWTAILGGALTLAVVAAHRLRRRIGQPEIPYGVAIAIGAVVTVAKANGLA